MSKNYFIITSVLILAIIITFVIAINRSNDPNRVLVSRADYVTEGSVSFIEVGSYTNLSTQQNTETIKQVLEKQKVKYAFYNYGLDETNLMYSGAVECAGSNVFNKRKDLHDYIRKNTPTKSEIFVYADELDIDISKFQECLEIKKPFELKIEQNNELISKIKLKQFPLYIIDGKIYEGPTSFEALTIAISQSKGL